MTTTETTGDNEWLTLTENKSANLFHVTAILTDLLHTRQVSCVYFCKHLHTCHTTFAYMYIFYTCTVQTCEKGKLYSLLKEC